MSKLEIPIITHPTRLCKVSDEYGYFHMWEQFSKPVDASPVIGGAPAGIVSFVYGIVEFKDGVRRVDPTDIRFVDEDNETLKYYAGDLKND